MNKQILLEIAQLIACTVLIGLVLLQSKGVGLSATFGGAGFATSKRGVEKVIFYFTLIVLVVLSILSLLLTIKV